MTQLSRRCALMLAGALGAALMTTPPVAAQQQAPLPPGSPLIGRPDTDAAKRLAPVAPPPIPATADKLPIDKLKAPKGFTIEVYASGVDNARTLRLGDKGTVFVSSRLKDKIHAIVDKGGTREVKVVASGLYRPNSIVLHKGTLYIAELSQISKIDNIEDKLDNPPKPTSSSAISRRMRRTAGNISRSVPTRSSISRSAHPATSACRPSGMPRSTVSI